MNRTELNNDHGQVLLFDGVCNLCNAVVQYVLNADKTKHIKFSALQSNFGQSVLRDQGWSETDLKTFVYLRNGAVHTRSTAFLHLMNDLGGRHYIFHVCWIIPRFLRDGVYNLVARTRYGIFGKRDECYLPSPELEKRFID